MRVEWRANGGPFVMPPTRRRLETAPTQPRTAEISLRYEAQGVVCTRHGELGAE